MLTCFSSILIWVPLNSTPLMEMPTRRVSTSCAPTRWNIPSHTSPSPVGLVLLPPPLEFDPAHPETLVIDLSHDDPAAPQNYLVQDLCRHGEPDIGEWLSGVASHKGKVSICVPIYLMVDWISICKVLEEAPMSTKKTQRGLQLHHYAPYSRAPRSCKGSLLSGSTNCFPWGVLIPHGTPPIILFYPLIAKVSWPASPPSNFCSWLIMTWFRRKPLSSIRSPSCWITYIPTSLIQTLWHVPRPGMRQ